MVQLIVFSIAYHMILLVKQFTFVVVIKYVVVIHSQLRVIHIVVLIICNLYTHVDVILYVVASLVIVLVILSALVIEYVFVKPVIVLVKMIIL